MLRYRTIIIVLTINLIINLIVSIHGQSSNQAVYGWNITELTTISLTSCPSGWTEVTELNGKTLVGTLSGNPTAGGSASYTPAGTINTPTFTGTQFDNRSAFVKVIFCKKS